VDHVDELQPREIADYLTHLAVAEHRDAVLEEMELRAGELGFPTVGRSAGRFLELMARSVGARRAMELGSGFGYSAYFLAGAVGPDGEVVCTDLDPANRDRAEGYLRRADRWAPVRWWTGDALEVLTAQAGEFDVIFCDVDKEAYPDAWRAASERLRVGGVWLCDNVLWDGRVAGLGDPGPPEREAVIEPIREMTRLVVDDDRYVSSIVPLRDGIQVALRVA
jgi:caffeoyl-CoA O-methyltransferase